MSYRAFPMPDDYPDYPNHFQVAKYFDEYVERFGLEDGSPSAPRSSRSSRSTASGR